MSVVLCTLCLNELEWLPKLWEQHKDWPGLARWVFVEAADRVYAQVNPGAASPEGLSTDGTTEFLDALSKCDDRVRHVRHGFCSSPDPAQGKCEARDKYLRFADQVKPAALVVVDADEFWPRASQAAVEPLLAGSRVNSIMLRHREVWKPPSVSQPFRWEVVGGFWDIPYIRVWRWRHGMRYSRNHNTPCHGSHSMDRILLRLQGRPGAPEFVHMGFAAQARDRLAKNAYYAARGEGRTDKRGWYVESRAAWERWREGDPLPHGARVVPWSGPVPECFQA